MTGDILSPPRWSDGPPICVAENLPAFKDPKAIDAYHKANCPGASIVAKWQCRACALWHFDATGPDPAGSSSGTGRSAGAMRYRKKFHERDWQNDGGAVLHGLPAEPFLPPPLIPKPT